MNYNREFLVPYLHNICSLYLARRKIYAKLQQLENRIKRIEAGDKAIRALPSQPIYEKPELDFMFYLFVFGSFSLVKLYFEDKPTGFAAYSCLSMAIITGILAVVLFAGYLDTKKTNREKKKSYEDQVAFVNSENAKALRHNDLVRTQNLPSLKIELKEWEAECRDIDDTLNEMYSVNIIPRKYRDFYSSVYLYDYFESSRFTDLERALELYVLEEIKSRLDIIIQQQSEMILNQQMMIAEQRKTREQQERHANMMKSKLNSIIASNEERNTYLDMIEANTRATAYFAAANYLK